MLPGRTTAILVGGVIDIAQVNNVPIPVDQFIDVANELVTELCTNSKYSNYRLELIERWLAAHFYCIYDPRSAEDVAGDVRQRLESHTGYGLRNSQYGQQAMRLDTAGNLAVMDNADNKYAKVPAGLLNGVSIGVTHLGPCPGYPKGWYGNYGTTP